MIPLALAAAALSFTLSASAGLGGSLVLVPSLSLLMGAKQGIALGALLLGANNVAKVVVYRRWVPLRTSFWVIALTVIGAAVGARLLVSSPDRLVAIVVIVSFAPAMIFERMRMQRTQFVYAPALAFGAGATSGFSGTSGRGRVTDLYRRYRAAARIADHAGGYTGGSNIQCIARRALVHVALLGCDGWLHSAPVCDVVSAGQRANQSRSRLP